MLHLGKAFPAHLQPTSDLGTMPPFTSDSATRVHVWVLAPTYGCSTHLRTLLHLTTRAPSLRLLALHLTITSSGSNRSLSCIILEPVTFVTPMYARIVSFPPSHSRCSSIQTGSTEQGPPSFLPRAHNRHKKWRILYCSITEESGYLSSAQHDGGRRREGPEQHHMLRPHRHATPCDTPSTSAPLATEKKVTPYTGLVLAPTAPFAHVKRQGLSRVLAPGMCQFKLSTVRLAALHLPLELRPV